MGLVGVVSHLLAYALLPLGILAVDDGRYALLAAIGSIAIPHPLMFDFNLLSFVTQTARLGFTIMGHLRLRLRR